MACCAALTLLFAWAYRVIGWVGGGRAADEFAPPAAWPPHPAAPLAAGQRASRVRTPQTALGQALIVVGIAWFVAGMLAMHVLGVLDPIHSAPVDLAFHASGLWVATIGVALRFQPLHVMRSAA